MPPRRTTKALARIEETLQTLEEGTLRYQTLDAARRFKNSWLELGQYLATVHRGKHFKEWGYLTFETYCLKEIGIKRQTAQKLLMSYLFLEREEPEFLAQRSEKRDVPGRAPSFEAVNALRLARQKREIPKEDYLALREGVLEKGKEASQVRRDVRSLMVQLQPPDPIKERHKKCNILLGRLLASLRSFKSEVEVAHMLPAALRKEMESLARKIEKQLD